MRRQLTLFEAAGRARTDSRPARRVLPRSHQTDASNVANGKRRCLRTFPPCNGTDTSNEAARRIRPVASQQARRVFEFFVMRDVTGATDLEVQQALEMKGDTERPRRGELVKLGLIEDSGERRESEAGRLLRVYVVTGKPWPVAEVEAQA